ncbi:MAG: DUF2520 domain-containing protein [Acidimicrobiia bacterium]|nr:DUF2520 domain-containing protein [Acidimicrobiia bacterium]
MRILLVGPGRAGMSLAMAFSSAGHSIVGVVGRTAESARTGAEMVDAGPLTLDEPLPPADLLVMATRDGAIAPVARALAAKELEIESAVHVSGLTSVLALDPLRGRQIQTGSFHPLQTLPNPEAGAARLAGAYIAITADLPLRRRLEELAGDIGAMPFVLEDGDKALYHAAAAAAANFPLAALAMAEDLFAEAGVPWEAARPLVEAVVANAFDMGPRAALTGPVARGDVATVAAQLQAVRTQHPTWQVGFARFVELLARLTGRAEQIEAVLNAEEDD